MNGRVARALRREAEKETVGMRVGAFRKLYQLMKRAYKRGAIPIPKAPRR